jgi:hypothetical protein
MAEVGTCNRCGLPVRWVTCDGESVALDTIAVFDGAYRLVGESNDEAERITRPGFYGYPDHATTCPKKN